MAVKTFAPPDVCLRIYYESMALTGEVGSKEIKELFNGNAGSTLIARIKRTVLDEMAKRGVMRIGMHTVAVDILFEQLGLDVNRLEKYGSKLKKMRAVEQ